MCPSSQLQAEQSPQAFHWQSLPQVRVREPVPQSEMARFKLESQWGGWALDYLPADYAAGAHELRTSMLADVGGD